MRPSTVALCALPLLAGCIKTLPKLPDLSDLDKPTVRMSEFKVQDADFTKLGTQFTFEVDNPYPVGIDLQTLNWKLAVSGHQFLDGAKDKGVAVDAGATSTVKFPVDIVFADVFAIAAESKGLDEIPWNIAGDVAIDSPIGPISVPFDEGGVFPALHKPQISLQKLRVAKLDILKQTATLELDVGVETEQPSPLSFANFDYGLTLAGVDVASGAVDIQPIEGSGTVTLPIDLKLLDLGATIVDAVTKKTELKVGLTADAGVESPLGVIPFHVDQSTKLSLK